MWRAVVSQPFDRSCSLPVKGKLDHELGEFWAENVFQMPANRQNLSAYESNRVFLNDGGKQFIEVSVASQADLDSDSRSVISTDFDGDQRPDILVGSVGGGALRLFLNDVPNSGHRVRVKLSGKGSNRSGIGCRVIARLGNRQIVRDVFPANGFMGQSPADVLLGTGSATQIDKLTIRWPTGETQTFADVASDALVTVTEGESDLQVTPFE
jgi:hypothetical protein